MSLPRFKPLAVNLNLVYVDAISHTLSCPLRFQLKPYCSNFQPVSYASESTLSTLCFQTVRWPVDHGYWDDPQRERFLTPLSILGFCIQVYMHLCWWADLTLTVFRAFWSTWEPINISTNVHSYVNDRPKADLSAGWYCPKSNPRSYAHVSWQVYKS